MEGVDGNGGMIKGERRATYEEAFEQLRSSPIVLRPDAIKGAIQRTMMGFLLSFYSGLLLFATLRTWTHVSLPTASAVTIVYGVLVVALMSYTAARSSAGYELRADGEGLSLRRFGALVWSVPWASMVIERHGLGRSRGRIVLPDGRRVPLPNFVVEGQDRPIELSRILRKHVAPAPKTPAMKIVASVLVASSIGAVGFWLASVGKSMIDRYYDPDALVAQTTANILAPLAVLIVGGLLLAVGFIGLILPLGQLERKIKDTGASLHGPAFREFTRDYGRNPPPIEMEPGVKYRYLDPKALRSQRSGAVPVTIFMLLLCSMLYFVPYRQVMPGSPAGYDVLRAALTLLALLPLLALRGEVRAKACLDDTVWLEGDQLFVLRASQLEAFPAASPHSRKAPTRSRNGYGFMVWYETFTNERGKYRLDRRYLWPVEARDGTEATQ